MRMIYGARALKHAAGIDPAVRGTTMYELLGALAFATLVTGYVLAVFFVRHGDDGFHGRPSVRHEGKK
jgi:hypothetical protein